MSMALSPLSATMKLVPIPRRIWLVVGNISMMSLVIPAVVSKVMSHEELSSARLLIHI
jgi:hypothetical protein